MDTRFETEYMSFREDPGDWIKERKIPILATFPFIILILVIFTELIGKTNIVELQAPLNGNVFAQIISGGGALVLSYALVILYWSQTRIQEDQTKIQANQEKIMKQSYVPHLSGEIDSLNIVSSHFKIRNTGDGPAFNVRAEWEFGGQERKWEVPALTPDSDFKFPLLEKGEDNWYLNTNEIRKYLENSQFDTVLEYQITCEDMFGETHKFSDEVDFEVMTKRSEAQEMWEKDPLEEIGNEIGKIRRETRKISSYAKRRRREMGTTSRQNQINSVRDVFSYHDKLSFEEIQSLTGMSEHDLNRTLERLDEVGEIVYNTTTGTVKRTRGPGKNETLDAFNS